MTEDHMGLNWELQEFRAPKFKIGTTVRHVVAKFDGPRGIITSRQYIEDIPDALGYWQYFVRWAGPDGLSDNLARTDEVELMEE